MRKSILLASLAVISTSLHGMQDSFNNGTNIGGTNPPRLPLVFSDDSVMKDASNGKKANALSPIQWDIFENQTSDSEKIQKVFSDSSDSVYLPSVDEIFEEILNPKGKTGQSETFDSVIQTQIEQSEASGSTVLLSNKDEAIIGVKRKASENNETEKDSIEKKRIKTSNKENNFKSTTCDKENSPKNVKLNKKRYFAKKTGLKMEDFLKNEEIEKQKEEIELKLVKLKRKDDISRQTELESQNKELVQQNDQLKNEIVRLKQQVELFQAKEKQIEELNLKIAEQIKKITNLERLLKDKETEIQQINKNQTEESIRFQQENLRLGLWLKKTGTEILREKDNTIAELTRRLNNEKDKEPRLPFSWNQILQQKEQEIRNREGFWNNLLVNKDKQIRGLNAQLHRFQMERNSIAQRQLAQVGGWNNLLVNKDKQIRGLNAQLHRFQMERNSIAQRQLAQIGVTNLTTQLQQSREEVANLTVQLQQAQTETINLTNRLQETQRKALRESEAKNQELAKLKAKSESEIAFVRQEVADIYKSQQTDSKFEHLYQQTKQQLDEVKKNLEDSNNEIKKIQLRYETELNKKEGYKSEVNRLNQVLSDEKVKSEQQKKENEQANNTLNRILLGERWWQNMLKPLNASQKKNEDLREYLLKLMKHSSTRSLINRFSRDEYSEEIIRQLTHNVDIKEHFKILDTNQYYWSASKIRAERDLFSKSKGYEKDLLNALIDRNNRAQKQLSKMDKNNEFLMQIIRELKKDKDIRCYIRDGLELRQPELTARIDRYLTQDKSV